MGGDQPSDSPSTRARRYEAKLSQTTQTRELKKHVVDDNSARSSIRKRGRPAGKGDSQIQNASKVVEKDSAEGTSVILSSESKKLSGLRARKAVLNHDECMKLEVDQKKQTNDLLIQEKESPGGQRKQRRTHRRKRGRPQKVLVSSLNAAAIVLPYSGCKKLADYPSSQKDVSTDTFNTTSAKNSFGNGEGSNSQHDTQNSTKANRRTSDGKESCQTQDTNVVKMAESVCIITKEAKMNLSPGNNMSDDQPLSKWVAEMQSSGSSAVAKQQTESVTVKEIIKRSPDTNKQHIASDETDTQGPTVGTETLSAVCETELPFMKNASLWAVVESMEVFRKMPQKPHFRPLLSHKESSREGFALACMVNFCSAVESISRLQFDDPKEKIDDILDTLNDLESHGFSVQVLRDRIRELVSIKENHEQLRAGVDIIKKKVALCFSDISDQDNKIDDFRTEMKNLQEKIEKAEAIKVTKEREIADLQSKVQDVEETMKRTRSCYEELAGAL